MKHIKTFTALTAALFLAASLTACGSSYPADAQTLNTPAKASLSAAIGKIGNSGSSSSDSEEDLPLKDYAGEYIMFGLGDREMNFQNKKIVVDNEGIEGAVILYGDGTGVLVDGDIQEPVTEWTLNDGSLSIIAGEYDFSGTLEDGVIMISPGSYSETYYFALESADISSYSIIEEDDYPMACVVGIYYLTSKTSDDESQSLNRTQISWDALSSSDQYFLALYEGGIGSLYVGDIQSIEWNTDSIILNDEEYYFDFADGVIAVDMEDYILEFTYIGEGDIYLQLTLDEVMDEVMEIPGGFYSLGDSGLKYYVPDSYTMFELTEEDIADDLVSNFIEDVDINDNDYYDNDIFAYHYEVYDEDDLPDLEEILESMRSLKAARACYPIIINGIEFVCGELVYEDTDEHLFLFRTWHDNGYVTDIKYRTEESIMNDEFTSMVAKLASAICPDD